jgi:hypothetical protein
VVQLEITKTLPFSFNECITKENTMNIKMLKAALAGLVLSMSGFANAGLITTIDAGATNHIFASSINNGVGPISENGFTWTASNNGYYGYDNGWGLNQNGSWNNINLIGLNSSTGSFTVTFDSLVSDVLAFVNYAGGVNSPQASIGIYSINDVLLESFDLNGLLGSSTVNGGWNYGFERNTAEIKSIKFTNAFIVASNLRSFVDQPSTDVPEPSTLAIFALGIMGLASRRFKNQ